MRDLTITIITPWFNHHELVDDYLDAVLNAVGAKDETMIVDNGSDPPLWFADVSLSDNLGFSGGSNIGLNKATTEAVVFLNNDIAATRGDWLERMRDAIEPGVLAGPIIDPDHATVDGSRFPYIQGWCLGGMRDELVELGGMPILQEPAYYSDNIICIEARLAGMRLRHVPVGLTHKEGTTAQHNPQIMAAAQANRARYLEVVRGALTTI